MTIQEFIKQGHKWIELKGVPVRDSHSKSTVFIHNHFFEGKELEFQNELIAHFMKHCPDREWHWRVYGGDTPDDDMVGWIYTQTAEIVSGDESVMPTSEITEAEGIKVGDKVRHNKHEEVATVTAIREAFVNGCDGYRYLYTLDFGQSVKGPFDMELNGGEFLREAFTLQDSGEIKPKAAFQIGDRVERKSDGERGTVDSYGVTDGKLTYIVKYDRTQCRQSDGFEYLSEELNGDELQAA